jgi:steroid 5-alpha reductase family enzyme
MLLTLLVSLGLSIVINKVMFLFAYFLKSDKLTDASYAISFITLAIFDYIRSPHNQYDLILLILVSVWAIRIGSFLLYRVMKVGKDRRFDGMRENFFRFAKFWFGQAVTVWVLMLPFALLKRDGNPSLRGFAFAGLLIWLAGIIIEGFSDIQKYRFHSNPKNKQKWIDEGLWHYSRHPNYYGEILVWIGLYLSAFVYLSNADRAITLISPLFITILLCFVSGIPILEKSAEKKWGKSKDYQEYKESTSLLIIAPKK